MPFIEAPTTFYLGKRVDPRTDKLTDDVVYYDSRDLMTHAVVVGMTGSGKTGLCISLLEEAVLDNIPAIVIDPKGDITNLLLTFPNLQPQDFRPWVNEDEARRAGMTADQYAANVAGQWQEGLHNWHIVPDRIKWLQMATQYSIYTPGSDAGLPISILASLRAPREGWFGNEEALRERINGVTTALLALAGKNTNQTDKEHVLIANIFEFAWQNGRDLTLEDIILQIQKPPFEKLGVFPIDNYITERARSKLAMEMNSIIASPSFQSWLVGQPIDIPSLLRQPNGRPRVSIFYIAHLSEQERQFMITLLLENMLGWMRTQSGTTSLRAILYIDEMFGYFPPYPKNPPTKEPILRLLKQARAFGVGLILATQNPGDLDYKGLTNAGTWFIGRLQSDNDLRKVMAGLEQMASADDGLNLNDVEQMVAGISPRVFLMRNVHDDSGPILLHTRWAMSYLSGPLTRMQIQALMAQQKQELAMMYGAAYGGGYPQQQPGWGGQSQPIQPAQQGFFGGGPQIPQPPMPPQQLPGQQMPGQYGQMPAPPPGLPQAPTGMPGMSGVATFGAQSAPSQAPNAYQRGWNQPPAYPNQYGQQGGYGGQTQPFPAQQVPPPTVYDSQVTTAQVNAPKGFSVNRPPVPSTTPQYFLPSRITAQQAIANWEQRTGQRGQSLNGSTLVYNPVLLAQAVVRFQEKKATLYIARIYTYLVEDLARSGLIHWEDYFADPIDARSVAQEPFEAAAYGDLTPGLADESRMKAVEREVVDMLYNTARLPIPYNPHLKIYGDPDNLGEFQAAVEQAAREQRDAEVDKLSQKYGKTLDSLEDKLRRKAQELRAEKKELKDRKREELFTTGEALHGLWKGRTAFTLSRMSRATRYRRQTTDDIQESHESIREIESDINVTEQKFEQELYKVNERWAQMAADTQEHLITPYKKDIQLELFGIGWVPSWYMNVNGQTLLLSAYS